jgi:hypothetical protein
MMRRPFRVTIGVLGVLLTEVVSAQIRGVVLEQTEAEMVLGSRGNWGIFVGVDRFNDKQIVPLKYAAADAQAIHTALTQPGGLIPPDQAYLHISGNPDYPPTRSKILASIGFAVKNATETGMIVVFLSSHGFDHDGQSYVMPEDGERNALALTALNVAEIETFLQEARANKRLVFIDACRENPQSSAKGLGGSPGMSDQFLNVFTIPEGARFKDIAALKDKSDIGDQTNKKIIAPLAKVHKLSDMDARIAILETKLSKARQIKQGMMQELLTGRIRLI